MNKDIRFIDSRYNKLFTVPDGGNIVVTEFDGRKLVRPCQYLDDTHFEGGGNVFHICQYAEIMERDGAVYAPEIVKPGDICDTYEIYQIADTRGTDYCFRPFDEAENQIRRADYQRVYAGVLASQTTMGFLFVKHNRDNRPFGKRMRSLSMSDVIVLGRAGKQQAFYVDTVDFRETPEFLGPEPKKDSPHRAVGKRGREYER
jgi:hypothetical protein